MITKQNIYYLLILLTLISFGFFGSLSHIFSFSLIILIFANYIRNEKRKLSNFKNLMIFIILSSCFFIFLLTSVFHNDFEAHFYSLSPMLPIPMIGMLLIFDNGTDMKLSSKKVSQYSQISIFCTIMVYLLLKISTNPESSLGSLTANRLALFSGNPIPFSFCVLGISIFCLTDWRHSNKKNKMIAFLLFLTGSYFAGYLTGTRGTLLALLFISPIVIFYLSNKLTNGFLIISTIALVGLLIFQTTVENNIENPYFNRIKNGIETITLLGNSDNSIWLRLDMWSAGIKAIFEAPIIGYGIAERFNALKPYLNNSNINFTHPHNDIIAGFISSGFLGGIAVLISLVSGFISAILTPKRSSAKLYFGLMITCSAVITGNVSTVLFNDISSAWLAFSTYLIWATDFKDDHQRLEN